MTTAHTNSLDHMLAELAAQTDEVRVSRGAIRSVALAGAFLAAHGVIVRRHSPRVPKAWQGPAPPEEGVT